MKVAAGDIGVITPYKAMTQLLRSKFEASPDWRAIKVDTVDAFQGQQKRVSSVSHSHPHKHIVGWLVGCLFVGWLVGWLQNARMFVTG